jgi:hypothetical protein
MSSPIDGNQRHKNYTRLLSHEPDRFQIKYTGDLAAYPGQETCVKAVHFARTLALMPCDFGELEIWYFDTFGQLRLLYNDEFCLSWSKYNLNLSKECKSEPSDDHKVYPFVFDSVGNSLIAQKEDRNKYLGLNKEDGTLALFKNQSSLKKANNPTIFMFFIERPSHEPSLYPSHRPSLSPTQSPSVIPSDIPSTKPSECLNEPGWVVGGFSNDIYFGWTCEDVEKSAQAQDICSEIDAIEDASFQQKEVRYMSIIVLNKGDIESILSFMLIPISSSFYDLLYDYFEDFSSMLYLW